MISEGFAYQFKFFAFSCNFQVVFLEVYEYFVLEGDILWIDIYRPCISAMKKDKSTNNTQGVVQRTPPTKCVPEIKLVAFAISCFTNFKVFKGNVKMIIQRVR